MAVKWINGRPVQLLSDTLAVYWINGRPIIITNVSSVGGTAAPTAVLSGPLGGPLVGCF